MSGSAAPRVRPAVSPTGRGLVGRDHAAAEGRVAEQGVLGLRAGLQHPAEPVGELHRDDHVVALAGRDVGVGVVVHPADAADRRRLAAFGEREQVVAHARARRVAVALAVLAAHVLGGDQPGRGERHRGGVAVDVGHLARVQDAVVVVGPCRQPDGVDGPDRQQVVLVVLDLALGAERVERGDRQPARHPARVVDVVAVPCGGHVVAARRPGHLVVAVVHVPGQGRQQVAELLRVLRRPGLSPRPEPGRPAAAPTASGSPAA